MADEYTCRLDAAGSERARNELGEISTDREAAVQALREWVLAQSDWIKSPTDTQFLLGFLRHRKFSQKAAKERLIQYWKVRTQIPEWFSHIDSRSEKISKALRGGMYIPLPKPDRDGCLVLIIRVGLTDLKGGVNAINAQFAACGAIYDLALRRDSAQVCGCRVLCDFTGVTLEHIKILADCGFKKLAASYMNAYPMRVGGSHYYNIGVLFEAFFTIVRPLFPKKIIERTKTHQSLKTVYDNIDMTILPRGYLPDDYTGPHAGTVQEILDNCVKDMEQASSRDYLLYMSSGEFYCDESKKPADAVPTESFRSLQL